MGSSTVAIGKDEQIFMKKETALGVYVPVVGADMIPIIADSTFKQEKGFLEDKQKRLTLSRLGRIPGVYNPGEFTINAYLKPAGSLGVVPMGNQLIEGTFQKAPTIVGSTSVTYNLPTIADDPLSYSIVFKKGHITFWNLGCVVDKGSFPVKAGNTDDAIGQGTFTGFFLKQIMEGHDTVKTTASIAAVYVKVNDIKQHEVGAYVKFGTNDNAGAGYLIDAVGVHAVDEITIHSGLTAEVPATTVIDGWIPTAADSGTLVHGRYGSSLECVSGGTPGAVTIVDALIEIQNNIKVLEEKTGTAWPTDLLKSQLRNVNITVNKIFKHGDALYFAESKAQTHRDMRIPVGNVAAYRYRFEAGLCEFDLPELSGADEVTIGRKGICLATSAFDNEIKLVLD